MLNFKFLKIRARCDISISNYFLNYCPASYYVGATAQSVKKINKNCTYHTVIIRKLVSENYSDAEHFSFPAGGVVAECGLS